MITEEMIKAGKEAYWGHFGIYGPDPNDCFSEQIKAIYEAMQKAAYEKEYSRRNLS